MTVNDLETALAATNLSFAHFAWSHAPHGDYGVFAEDGAADLEADGKHAEKGITGTIDYFTRSIGTPKDTIETALDNLGCAYRLNSIQYESDTGYIHYEWIFGLYG